MILAKNNCEISNDTLTPKQTGHGETDRDIGCLKIGFKHSKISLEPLRFIYEAIAMRQDTRFHSMANGGRCYYRFAYAQAVCSYNCTEIKTSKMRAEAM